MHLLSVQPLRSAFNVDRYGGTLLASYEYNLMDFFIIYMAIVQGAVAAGMWFSFAPSMLPSSPLFTFY